MKMARIEAKELITETDRFPCSIFPLPVSNNIHSLSPHIEMMKLLSRPNISRTSSDLGESGIFTGKQSGDLVVSDPTAIAGKMPFDDSEI